MSVLFVDESKTKGYTMVAAIVADDAVPALRRDVRSLVLPGQRRIHFMKERDERKRFILSRFVHLGVRAQVFYCAAKSAVVGREVCLTALISYAAEQKCFKIVFERDESIERADRKFLYGEVRKRGLANVVKYDFKASHDEPLLWIPDAIAWSHVKGGDWKRRTKPLVDGFEELSL